jgi:hypothetical protein
MGTVVSETCWAVSTRQSNKYKIDCASNWMFYWIDSNVFDFYFLVWSLSRPLCWVGRGFNVAAALFGITKMNPKGPLHFLYHTTALFYVHMIRWKCEISENSNNVNKKEVFLRPLRTGKEFSQTALQFSRHSAQLTATNVQIANTRETRQWFSCSIHQTGRRWRSQLEYERQNYGTISGISVICIGSSVANHGYHWPTSSLSTKPSWNPYGHMVYNYGELHPTLI